MSHLQPVSLHARLAACLALAVGASSAQAQRVEIVRTAPRTATTDSAERQLKLVQRKLDSLIRIYNESDDISSMERRRVVEAINVMVSQLRPMIIREGELVQERAPTAMRVQMAERTPESMARALVQVRDGVPISPRGWIGFVTEGVNAQWVDDNSHEVFVRYFSYPRILSVDPSSPAQRAGIEPSDTLIAYDGRDVRGNDISLTQLLRPNTKVSVRLRRDGKVREVPVVIGTASNRIMLRRDDQSRTEGGVVAMAGGMDVSPFPRVPAPPSPVAVGTIRPARPPMPPGGAASAGGSVTLSAPTAPTGQRVPGTFAFTMNNNGVAGAELGMVTEDWASRLGTSTGVFVVNAPVGSPARESGLQGSDVIVKVSGQSVRTVGEVREIVRRATLNGEHSLELDLVRNLKPMKLTLKW